MFWRVEDKRYTSTSTVQPKGSIGIRLTEALDLRLEIRGQMQLDFSILQTFVSQSAVLSLSFRMLSNGMDYHQMMFLRFAARSRLSDCNWPEFAAI